MRSQQARQKHENAKDYLEMDRQWFWPALSSPANPVLAHVAFLGVQMIFSSLLSMAGVSRETYIGDDDLK